MTPNVTLDRLRLLAARATDPIVAELLSEFEALAGRVEYAEAALHHLADAIRVIRSSRSVGPVQVAEPIDEALAAILDRGGPPA